MSRLGRLIIHVALVLVVIAPAKGVVAQYRVPNQKAYLKTWSGGTKFEFRIFTGAFRPDRHQVVLNKEQKLGANGNPIPTLVDGRRAWGSPDTVPNVEITRLQFRINGRKWFTPSRKLWADCFGPHHEPRSLRISQVAGGCEVSMAGSDGYGTYDVAWKVDRRGRVSRKISKRLS